jgi:tetratricopeptide (TPR) repeat protein
VNLSSRWSRQSASCSRACSGCTCDGRSARERAHTRVCGARGNRDRRSVPGCAHSRRRATLQARSRPTSGFCWQSQTTFARNELGGLFERLSLYLRALEQYEAANALAPDNIEILLKLGNALISLGRYEQAEREFRRAQKLDPSRADVFVHAGILQFKRGLYLQADLELKKALELRPDDPLAHFYRGECLNQLSRVDEALDALQRSVQLQPTNARAYYLMGIQYDKKRLPELAMAMYKKARAQHA